MKVIAPLAGEHGHPLRRRAGRRTAGLRVNGRGLAAADVDNDGRMEIAVNSIGGKLLLLKPTGPVGHWLDVRLSRFSPGAVVTVDLGETRAVAGGPRGQQLPVLRGRARPLRARRGDAGRAGAWSAIRGAARASCATFAPTGSSRSPCRRTRPPQASRPSGSYPPPRPARRRPATARSRRSGTRRRSTRSAPAPRASRSRRATSSTSPPRCGTPGSRAPEERVRPQRRDQLRRLPGAPLGRVLRLEPEPDVRPADARAARALLLAGLHHHERRVAGGAREPDRRSRDRRRPARRLERVAALRRPDLHVAEPAADRPRSRSPPWRTRPSGSRWRSGRSSRTA